MSPHPADKHLMRRAIALARQGLGRVSPNPPVGCVLAHDGEVVGGGFHEMCGGPHAEVNALADAGHAARGATAYVTLMPCDHHGRTAPCTQALLTAGVARVVVAVDDPNPTSGNGHATLQQAGVAVEVGCLQREAAGVMRGFLKHAATGKPFLHLKQAMTMDGRTATHTGDSGWISCEASRERVQHMRARADAILVGIGTALRDDPRLTARVEGAPQPRRVVFDSRGRLPVDCRLLREPGGEVVVVLGPAAPEESSAALQSAGARVLRVETEQAPSAAGVDLHAAFDQLTGLGIREVFCEGGAALASSLIREGYVDLMSTFLAPKAVGGVAPSDGMPGLDRMADAHCLHERTAEWIGPDLLIQGKFGEWPEIWLSEDSGVSQG